MDVITRRHYAEKLDSWIGKGCIIVVTGARRVGKSFVLKDFIQRHNEPDTNIIYIDKEKKAFNNLKNRDELNAHIEQHFIQDKHNFILIDEVQEIEHFEESIRSWQTEENTDIIITGSNAKMLSGEISSLLSGRFVEIRVHPLTYPEFLVFHHLPDNDESLLAYLHFGGLPGLARIGTESEELVWEYLRSVFNTVMLKDILERNEIRNIPFMNNLVAFFADNIGKLNSANGISKYMKSQGENVSTNLILQYRSFYEEAYLLHVVPRYDIHGKKIFESNEKIYWDDLGMRNLLAEGSLDSYMEKVIENVVYKHLIFIGYDVKVGVLQAGEVDFVCTKPGRTAYVQVAYLVSSPDTREREFGTLERIRDNHPKYVISATPLLTARDENGITHLSLRVFLKNGI